MRQRVHDERAPPKLARGMALDDARLAEALPERGGEKPQGR